MELLGLNGNVWVAVLTAALLVLTVSSAAGQDGCTGCMPVIVHVLLSISALFVWSVVMGVVLTGSTRL